MDPRSSFAAGYAIQGGMTKRFLNPGRFALLLWLIALTAGCNQKHVQVGSSTVAATKNPLVALYTIQPSSAATVVIQFGPTRAYGFTTSEQATPAEGGPVNIYVAGMRANTTYHMRASVKFNNGDLGLDKDHSFTTGSFPAAILPGAKVSVSPGAHPQSGIELVDATLSQTPGYLEAYATDLQGNLIWGYDYPDRDANSIIQPIKLLPNGHFGMMISFASQFIFTPSLRSAVNTLREIDLAGNTIRELKLDDLNQRLKAAGYTFTLLDYHHDFAYLPNGHWMVLANLVKPYTDLPGFPGTTQVIGDALIDLDADWNPVWVWNEFDHLDVNRHPMSFPDWTHTNAVVYLPEDGNLLVSMRHQNWIVKVDYRNGAGEGNILWRLGQGGDFQLLNGTDPTDWFYAQHGPDVRAGKGTSGFLLSVMDNGDDRMFPTGVNCNTPGQPACLYSTVPVYQVDEQAMTASLTFHQVFPADEYSFFGGITQWLANGNLEYDLCAEPGFTGIVGETTGPSSPQTVWQMVISGSNVYRAGRIPSLYPGVSW
jgi:arylsulfate sulfotransferase